MAELILAGYLAFVVTGACLAALLSKRQPPPSRLDEVYERWLRYGR